MRTDITFVYGPSYESIANAFNSPLDYHQPTLERMKKILTATDPSQNITESRKRMALIPKNAQVVFTSPDLWVRDRVINQPDRTISCP
ncbi:MAG: hypothetical protein BJ554DRAFT_3684 [Olpidium bornovanus]|uniref:Uncharacterized protein n=1 Tax=Olpidium bornovanus TaxID=278681 RepID=A0A8H8DFM7_9FUNG|nr:MAG: hypothetical protein BJ554DRAFT_3684 [Olpidium bornovanus]